MSTCKYCCSPSFVLDRNSGVMRCSSCGRQNYVGSPSYYEEGIGLVAAKKTNKPDESLRDSYLPNAAFGKSK